MIGNNSFWMKRIKKNTQKATQSAVSQFEAYLQLKNLPNISAISKDLLVETLLNFYVEVRPKNDENYAVQSLKCKRAALNRYFKPNRGIDITTDTTFTKANEMFKGVCVHSKKQGKGVRKSYPNITSDDMHKFLTTLLMITSINLIQRSYKRIWYFISFISSVVMAMKTCTQWEKILSQLS